MFARSPSRELDRNVTSTTANTSVSTEENFKLEDMRSLHLNSELKAKLHQFTHAAHTEPQVQVSQAANAAFLHAALAELFGSSEALARALSDKRFVSTLPVMEKIITADTVTNAEKVEMITVLVVKAQRMLQM